MPSHFMANRIFLQFVTPVIDSLSYHDYNVHRYLFRNVSLFHDMENTHNRLWKMIYQSRHILLLHIFQLCDVIFRFFTFWIAEIPYE